MRTMFSRRRRPEGIVCREAVSLMTEYLEGTLLRPDVIRLEEHLSACPHCHEYLAQMRLTIDALGYVTPADLTDDALNDLVDLYRRWQSEA